MELPPGTPLGPYSIRSLIGAGGMGVVYRAHDSKLRREVALKVLPHSLAADVERRDRLRQEALILAAVNHPSIASIYDLHDSDDIVALVMELVDGPTLADRIAAGPLPVSDALSIAAQIADALEAAHEKGIVHRDLKPANIKLTDDGRVKVLDFGLAKALTPHFIDGANSPTVSMIASRVGAIQGTLGYMSPEQARGSALDKRVDIWAFGCVLFEMLTGRPAFTGNDVPEFIVAVMTREPDWAALPAVTPPRIVELLKRCLKRQPRERLRDIGDARLEIDAARSGDARPAVVASSTDIRFQRLTDFVGMNEAPAISPDGKVVAFVSAIDGRRQIWIRLLAGGGPPLQLTRAEADHEQPRWAPDSSAVIYYTRSNGPDASGMLWEIPALGGPPRPIVAALGGGDISHDGRRIAVFQAVNGSVELAVVSRDGVLVGFVRPLPAMVSCDCPRWSPDDRFIAFQVHVTAYFDQRICVVPAERGPARDVVRGTILKGITWLPDGRGLVYSSSAGTSLPYPPTFNLRLADITGSTDRQLTFGDASHVEPDVHSSGLLLASRIRSHSDIWRVPVSGSPSQNARDAVRVTQQSGRVQTPAVSPNGREVAYLSDSGGHGNLWVAATDGRSLRQITFEQDQRNNIAVPVWSPTGSRIVFLVTRDGAFGLWVVNSDGSGRRNLHTPGVHACWSGDGRWLYYSPPDTRPWRILKKAIDGGEPVEVRSDDAISPAVTSDGSAMYYFALVDQGEGSHGDWELRVARPEHGPSTTLARIAGTRVPISFFLVHMSLSPDGSCLAMPLTDGSTTNLWAQPTDGGAMRPLTDFGAKATIIGRRVAWAPDGQSLYAAIEEMDADVVSIVGLLA
ncbi:MAG TPA: LpqB family beta-propeller domain-containing protein [Vicinamibacterales bacterium]|jgi:Tol biopolymer transport system component